MTDKAYIVANEQQELEALEKLERWGAKWGRSESKPTDFIPSHVEHTTKLPYALLVENDQISWCDIEALYEFDDIAYDGRKEDNMSKKYVVSQDFIDDLKVWKAHIVATNFINGTGINHLPINIDDWWGDDVPDNEKNNRLIAIIRWVNGEDVFEVEKPKKWVVRSKDTDVQGDYWYVYAYNTMTSNRFTKADATHFDTKEEAESWANAHQEVVEVEE